MASPPVQSSFFFAFCVCVTRAIPWHVVTLIMHGNCEKVLLPPMSRGGGGYIEISGTLDPCRSLLTRKSFGCASILATASGQLLSLCGVHLPVWLSVCLSVDQMEHDFWAHHTTFIFREKFIFAPHNYLLLLFLAFQDVSCHF